MTRVAAHVDGDVGEGVLDFGGAGGKRGIVLLRVVHAARVGGGVGGLILQAPLHRVDALGFQIDKIIYHGIAECIQGGRIKSSEGASNVGLARLPSWRV